LVRKPQFFSFPVCDLLIDVIDDDSADVPEGAGTRSISIEKEQRPRIGG